LSHELAEFARTDQVAGAKLAEAARELEEEVVEFHEAEHQPTSEREG